MDAKNLSCKKFIFYIIKKLHVVSFFFICSTLFALNNKLSIHIFCEKSPFRWNIEKPLVDEKEAVKSILTEARLILSGMLYGYSFLYTPSDKARQIEELFELKPTREIPWGDPQLSVAYYDEKDNQLNGRVNYDLSEAQAAHLKAWESNTIPVASGRGYWSVFEGSEPKQDSIKEAIKQAIRSYLRPREFNKPREIAGEVLIWNEPRTVIISGDYVTTIKIKLLIKSIEAYKVF